MIAMKMTNKNIINTMGFYAKSQHLLLCSLAAINKEKLFIYIKKLCGGISIKDGCCRTTAENRNLKFHKQ
jgi:hypothetical protein